MKLWCCLCFNEEEEEEEEEEERRNLAEPMKKEEDIFVNVGADDDEAEARNDEAGFLEELAMVAPLQLDSLGSWSASRRSEGEGSSGAAIAVAAAGSESPAAYESRDLSHKRAKFYNECHFAAPTSSSNVKYSLDYGDCDLSLGPSTVTCYNDFALMCTGEGGNGEEDSSLYNKPNSISNPTRTFLVSTTISPFDNPNAIPFLFSNLNVVHRKPVRSFSKRKTLAAMRSHDPFSELVNEAALEQIRDR